MAAKTKMGRTGARALSAMPGRAPTKAKVGGRLAARGGKVSLKGGRAMPAKRRTAKAGAKAGGRAAKSNVYVQALMHDDTLHDQLEEAYRSLLKAYERISRQDDVADALLDDRRTRRHLRSAATSLREAADRLRHARGRRRQKRGGTTILLVGVAGGVTALAVSEDLRARLIGLFSGSEGGFQQGTQGSNGVVPSAPAENAPPTTTS